MTTKEINKPEKGIVARSGARGLAGFDKKDLALAHISLLQGLSKKVTKEGRRPGTFTNTLSGEDLGASFEFVPISCTKYWDLLKKDSTDPAKMAFDGRTYDENDARLAGRAFFNDKAKGIKATVNSVISFLILVDGEPALLNFSKSSYKSGKRLGTIASLSGKDLFATKYKALAKVESKSDHDYFVIDIEEVSESSDSDYRLAEKMFDSFGSRMNVIADKAPSEDGSESIETTSEKAGVRQNPPEGQGADSFEEPAAPAGPVYTRVRVLKEVRTDEEKKCPKCSEIRTVKNGNVKTNDPETGLIWGKVTALICKCGDVSIISKIAD